MSLLDYFRPRRKKIGPETKTVSTESLKIAEALNEPKPAEIQQETAQKEQAALNPAQELLAKLRHEHAEAIRVLSKEGWEDPFWYDEEVQTNAKVLLRYAIHETDGKKKLCGFAFKLVKPEFEIQFNNLFKLPAHTLEEIGIPLSQLVFDRDNAKEFDHWLDQGHTCSQRDYLRGRYQYNTEKFIYRLADQIPGNKSGDDYLE